MITLRRPWYQKTWLKNNLDVILLVIILVQKMKWTIVVKQSTTTKMESHELKNERLLMKSMNIEIHDNVKISVAKGVHKGNVEHFFSSQTLLEILGFATVICN